MSKTIQVKNYSNVVEELEAEEALTPGHLVEVTSAGKVQKNTSAGYAPTLIALENLLIGNGIDDDYAAADKVQVWVAQRGDMAQMFLAASESVSIGDFLESDGAGALQAMDSTSVVPVVQAVEAVDAPSDGTARIIVRIL